MGRGMPQIFPAKAHIMLHSKTKTHHKPSQMVLKIKIKGSKPRELSTNHLTFKVKRTWNNSGLARRNQSPKSLRKRI